MKIDIRSKYFGSSQVLGSIMLTVSKGETIALTGPSGIGKTTLVRIIAGLDHQYQGQITYDGKIGMVFQEPTLLPWRNLRDNITIATGCDGDFALEALAQVELDHRADVYPGQLSLGQQRRVALARALATKPQILILDEAFASLDESTASRMRELTQRVLASNSFCTILVTHNLQEAAEMANRVLVLDGSPAEIVMDQPLHNRGENEIQGQLDLIRNRMSDAIS